MQGWRNWEGAPHPKADSDLTGEGAAVAHWVGERFVLAGPGKKETRPWEASWGGCTSLTVAPHPGRSWKGRAGGNPDQELLRPAVTL